MKIGILNDTHLGLTTDGQLKVCFRELAKQHAPDMIVHAGDYCGATHGHRALRLTCEMMRDIFPEIPIISVIGNHDFWCGKNPSLHDFTDNYEKVKEAFKNNRIHFLDEDGIFRIEDLTFFGCTGWYHERRDSNDWNFIPKFIEGDTQAYLNKRANDILHAQLGALTEKDTTRLFVSHFPVVDCFPWDWNPNIGEMLEKHYNVKRFISGHSHGIQTGPRHYRSSSDYGKPAYFVFGF